MSGGGSLGRATFILDADTSGLDAAFSRAENVARAGTDRISGLLKTGLAVGFGVNTFNTGLVALRRALDGVSEGVIDFNAKIQSTTAVWDKLLGGATAAQAKITDLFNFAKETPFDFADVLKGATILQTLGGSALDSAANLRLFGDAAAATVEVTGSLSQGFQQTTFWTARLYEALQGGQPLGRALTRLQQLGLVNDQVRSQIELARQLNVNPDQIFAIYKHGLQQFQGLQDEQQKNFQTQISTFQDRLTQLEGIAGKNVFDTLVAGLTRVNDALNTDRVQKFAEALNQLGAQGIAALERFFARDDVQAALKAWADAGIKFGRDMLETGKEVIAVVTPIAQTIGAAVGAINALTQGHAAFFAIAISGMVKYRQELQLAHDLLTGQVSLFGGIRGSQGQLLTAKQQDAVRAKAQADADAAIAAAEEKVAAAEDRAAAAAARAQRADESLYAIQLRINQLLDERQRRTDALAAAEARRAKATADAAAADARVATGQAAQGVATREVAYQGGQLSARTNRLSSLTGGATPDEVRAALQAYTTGLQQVNTLTQKRQALEADVRQAQAAEANALNQQKIDLQALAALQNRNVAPSSLAYRRAQQRVNVSARQVDVTQTAAAETRAKLGVVQGDEAAAAAATAQALADLGGDAQKAEAALAAYDRQAARVAVADRALAAASKEVADALKAQADAANLAARTAEQAQQKQVALQDTGARLSQARLAEASAIRSQQQAQEGLAAAQEDVVAAQAAAVATQGEQATLLGTLGTGMAVASQAAIGLGVAFVGLNAISNAISGQSLPQLIGSLIQYGDTLGEARQQVAAFNREQSQVAEADVAKNYQDQIAKTKQQIADLRDYITQYVGSPTFLLGQLFSDPGKLIGSPGQIKEAERVLTELAHAYDVLQKAQKLSNDELARRIQLGGQDASVYQAEADRRKAAADQARQDAEQRQADAYTALGVTPQQFTDLAQQAVKLRAQGADAFKQYVAGFKSAALSGAYSDIDVFQGLQKAATAALNPQGGTPSATIQAQLDSLSPILARATTEIRDFGRVSAETMDQLQSTAPGATDKILALARAYAAVDQAAGRAAAAQKAVDEIDVQIASTQRAKDAEDKQRQQAIQDLQDQAKAAARGYSDAINALQDQLQAITRAAEDTAAAWQKQIDQQTQALKDAQDAAQKAQDAETAHQGAFQAVLDGTTEEYLKQIDATDTLTRSIVARYDAEIGGARRLKDATSTQATAAEQAQRAGLLAFDEKIAQARTQGNLSEVARLEKQRQDYQTRTQRDVDLQRERAQVAQDQYDNQAKAVQKAAQQQDDADKTAVKAAGDKVKAAQATLDATQKQADAAAKAAAAQEQSLQRQIQDQQALANKTAQDYQDRIDASNKELAARDKFWQAELDNLNKAKAVHQLAADLSQAEFQHTKDTLDNLNNVNSALDTFNGELQKLIDLLQNSGLINFQPSTSRSPRAGEGLPQNAAQPPAPPATAPSTAPPSTDRTGTQEPGSPGTPAATTAPGGTGNAANRFPTVGVAYPARSDTVAPAGWHLERNRTGYWLVPDGYLLNDSAAGTIAIDMNYHGTPTSPTDNPYAPPPAPPAANPSSGSPSDSTTPGLTAAAYRPSPAQLRAASFGTPTLPSAPGGATAAALAAAGGGAFTYTQAAPLIGTAYIRSEADISALAAQIVGGLQDSFEQQRRALTAPAIRG